MEESFKPKPLDPKIERREQISIKCAFDTIPSEKHSDINEDSIIVDLYKKLFAILDGMGGHKGGDIASQMARDYIIENSSKIIDGTNIKEAEKTLEKIIVGADNFVWEAKNTKKNGMGATASVLKIHSDEHGRNWILMANVGDSRIYKIEEEGKIEQLTIDDDLSLIENKFNLSEDKLKKIIKKITEVKSLKELDEKEIYYFENRNIISKSLGDGKDSAKVTSIQIKKGDKFLITSDGIHDNLTTKEIEDAIKQSSNIEQAISNLMQRSIARSKKSRLEEIRAKKDDMSAIIVSIN